VEDAGRSSSKARGPHSRHDLAVNSPTWLDVHAGALTREVRDSQMEAAQQPGLHFHDLRVRELGDAERGHPATPAMTMRYGTSRQIVFAPPSAASTTSSQSLLAKTHTRRKEVPLETTKGLR